MRASLLIGMTTLAACDQVFQLERPDGPAVDAAINPGTMCLTDPSWRPLGTIPESRYWIGAEPMPWLAARDQCVAAGAHLVVDSHEDSEWIGLVGSDRLADAHWMGLSYISSAGFMAVTGEVVGADLPPWGVGEPNNTPAEGCAALKAGELRSESCDAAYLPACECEQPVTCTPPSVPNLYTLVRTEVIWDDASEACSSMGLRLAVVTRSAHLERIRDQYPGERLWVDATDRVTEGQWLSSAGCRPYQRWGQFNGVAEPDHQTDENCMAVDTVNMRVVMFDVPCARTYNVLCEMP